MTPNSRRRRWPGFRSVLCAVDFSEQSRQALRAAERVALRGSGALTVMYVADPLLVAAAAAALGDRGLAKRSAVELEAFVNATLGPATLKQLPVTTRVSRGEPAAEILKLAARTRSDLIVLGTQGLTGASRLLMGSTTARVLQQATRPVLAVPKLESAEGPVSDQSWPCGSIVAAVELDRLSGHEVNCAAVIAEWFGCGLRLVHVVGRMVAPAWFESEVSAHDHGRIAEAQEQLDRLARAASRRVPTTTHVVYGRVAEEVTAFAAAQRAGLVTTALRDRRGWFGASRGSVSYDVLSHATTPVLAFPSRWRPR